MIKRDWQGSNFTPIYNAALRDPWLTLPEKGLFAQMMSFPSGWHVSQRRLAAMAASSKMTIVRHIASLKDWRYIKIHTKKIDKKTIYIYELHSDPRGLCETTRQPVVVESDEIGDGAIVIDTGRTYEANFTLVPTAIFKDNTISYAAKALYALICSMPDTANISIDRIAKNWTKTGRDGVRSALKELLDHGYISREQNYKKSQFGAMTYFVHNDPKGLMGKKYITREKLHRYGAERRVAMTNREYQTLKRRYGEDKVRNAIDCIDAQKVIERKKAKRGDWERVEGWIEGDAMIKAMFPNEPVLQTESTEREPIADGEFVVVDDGWW